jgi:glycosyltransferase involved in cell wall biosynthesis
MTTTPLTISVLHVIQQLSRGGAARSLVATSKAAALAGVSSHTIVSLCPAEAGARRLAAEAGLPLFDAPSSDVLATLVSQSDIVQVHYWNTPELMAFCRACTQPARILLWCHVPGDKAPQLLPQRIARWADRAIASVPGSPGLPDVVLDTTDFSRLDAIAPRSHTGVVVGYVGTVDPVKMHPRFVQMSAAVRAPDVRFVVCGSGGGFDALRREAERLNAADRFEWIGYVEDVARVFEMIDVFGYPIVHGGAELVLQEALYAGVPPVVLSRGAWTPVVDNRTGLVAANENAYTRAIESLALDADKRRRLGAAAARDARERFGAPRSAAALNRLYVDLIGSPKQSRAWPDEDALRLDRTVEGARAFISHLGAEAVPFEASLTSSVDEDLLESESVIACASPMIVDASAGGLLHYRRHFLRDAHLRLWSGLVLATQGRPALAIAEFEAARALGIDHWRVSWYLGKTAASIGATRLAADALSRVPAEAS